MPLMLTLFTAAKPWYWNSFYLRPYCMLCCFHPRSPCRALTCNDVNKAELCKHMV